MISVSAKALWWHQPELCTCPPEEWNEPVEAPCPHDSGGWPQPMMFTEIDGWQFLTDRYVLMPTARLAELPVGYDRVLNLKPVGRQSSEGLAEWMTAEVLLYPSDRLFAEQYVDPLEKAGFLIRALAGVKDVHAVCDEDLTIVGLLNASRVRDPGEYDRVRRAAR